MSRNNLNNILNYYKKLSNPVKASLWFTVSTAMQRGITLLTMPIFTRLLTAEQYGIYSVYRSWYDILVIIGTLNIYGACYSKGLLKYEKNSYEFTSSMQCLMTLITLILSILYISNIKFWNKILGLTTMYVITLLIEMLFVPSYSLWCMKERFDYRYKKVVFTTVFISVMTPLLGVLAVLSTVYKAEARILSYVFVQLLISVPIYVFFLIKGKIFFEMNYWKYAFNFAIPLVPHYLSVIVLNQSDRIMINNLIGADKSAIYSVTYTISAMVSIVTNAINNSFLPYTYKSLQEKKYDMVLKNASKLCVIVFGLCVIAMLLGPEIIFVFTPPEYYEAIWVVPPVAASIYFVFLYNVFVNIELYYEKTSMVTFVTCVGAGLNIILNYYFIRIFGYIAAAYTTLLCCVLISIAHYIVVKRYRDRHYHDKENFDYKILLWISIVVLACVVLVSVSYKKLIIRISIVCVLLSIAIFNRKLIIQIINSMRK